MAWHCLPTRTAPTHSTHTTKPQRSVHTYWHSDVNAVRVQGSVVPHTTQGQILRKTCGSVCHDAANTRTCCARTGGTCTFRLVGMPVPHRSSIPQFYTAVAAGARCPPVSVLLLPHFAGAALAGRASVSMCSKQFPMPIPEVWHVRVGADSCHVSSFTGVGRTGLFGCFLLHACTPTHVPLGSRLAHSTTTTALPPLAPPPPPPCWRSMFG